MALDALKIAKLNSVKLGAEVSFVHSDWFKAIDEVFDTIVCNPPYIDRRDRLSLDLEVRNFDPEIALFPDIDAVNCYRLISKNLSRHLKHGGNAFFEVGKSQSRIVAKIFEEAGFKTISFSNDFSGVERVVCVKKDA